MRVDDNIEGEVGVDNRLACQALPSSPKEVPSPVNNSHQPSSRTTTLTRTFGRWTAMPDDDTSSIHAGYGKPRKDATKSRESAQKRGFFSIPPALKEIFDRYPLVVYEANELPIRAPKRRGDNLLYIFTTERDARYGRASFNPACLKWQVSRSVQSQACPPTLMQTVVDVPEVHWRPFPSPVIKQSRFSVRCSSLPTPGLHRLGPNAQPRSYSQQQNAEMAGLSARCRIASRASGCSL